jgi:hypothetical protein
VLRLLPLFEHCGRFEFTSGAVLSAEVAVLR